MTLTLWALQNWAQLTVESVTRFNTRPLFLDFDMFFYLAEHLFLETATPDSGMTGYSPEELRDHIKSALYASKELAPKSGVTGSGMPKASVLRKAFQEEKNPQLRMQKRQVYMDYMKTQREQKHQQQ